MSDKNAKAQAMVLAAGLGLGLVWCAELEVEGEVAEGVLGDDAFHEQFAVQFLAVGEPVDFLAAEKHLGAFRGGLT